MIPTEDLLASSPSTWRVGGLSTWLFFRLISLITPIRIPFRVLISLLIIYLLSPPTLQVRNGTIRGSFKESIGILWAVLFLPTEDFRISVG